MPDYKLIQVLLEALRDADPPEKSKIHDDMYQKFVAPNGWRMRIFYDADFFDYIEHFTSPDGEQINVWAGDGIDPRIDDSDKASGREPTLKLCKSGKDSLRLLALLGQHGGTSA